MKEIALQLASQLPEDKESCYLIVELLCELIEWRFGEPAEGAPAQSVRILDFPRSTKPNLTAIS